MFGNVRGLPRPHGSAAKTGVSVGFLPLKVCVRGMQVNEIGSSDLILCSSSRRMELGLGLWAVWVV